MRGQKVSYEGEKYLTDTVKGQPVLSKPLPKGGKAVVNPDWSKVKYS